jgi:hypothetical protein
MNRARLRRSPGLPIFADDLADVVATWRHLLELGVSIGFPAHREPSSADAIRRIRDAAPGSAEHAREVLWHVT